MGDMLSQEEINALLKGMGDEGEPSGDRRPALSTISLSSKDKGVIAKVSNIGMESAAATLFALIQQKVTITTQDVSVSSWDDVIRQYKKPCVAVQIVYTEGMSGNNVLILKEDDVQVITDLMMGGAGRMNDTELGELQLSAITEALNQMIGSSVTAVSSIFNKTIDIAPPTSTYLNLNQSHDPSEIADFLEDVFVKTAYRLKIGDLIDSELLHIFPVSFADDVIENVENVEKVEAPEPTPDQQPTHPAMDMNLNRMGTDKSPQTPQQPDYGMGQQPSSMGMGYPPNMGMGQPVGGHTGYGMNSYSGMTNYNDQYRNVEVQQAQFHNFDMASFVQQKENIDLIMDVPLEVTVELGRTHRSIKEILEFAPGTIIELNKLAGEPIDVLVNGKVVAKGEVVVIAENFSIRLTEIIKDSADIH